jgi:hypothetical protein
MKDPLTHAPTAFGEPAQTFDMSDYCRQIETYLCRKNDGHLIRITGPSFEVVSGWASSGVPLKVAFSGIDRYFERYYRSGPRRRPVKIDFCEADVLDLFDEWRRAVGLTATTRADHAAAPNSDDVRGRRGPSLPEHLERVLTKLSTLRATGVLTDAADPLLDRVSSELDTVRASSAGLRGAPRREAVGRLAALDDELIRLARASVPAPTVDALRQQALAEVGPYRTSMAEDAFEEAAERALRHAVRAHLGLPTIAFE